MNEQNAVKRWTKRRIRRVGGALCFAIGVLALAVLLDCLYARYFGTPPADPETISTKGNWGGAVGTAVGKSVNERLLLVSGPLSAAAFGLSMLLHNWRTLGKARDKK